MPNPNVPEPVLGDEDKAIITAAAARAPSVHNTQPWRLEFGDRRVSVMERTDLSLRRHDPFGRDRTISCGAALGNAWLAVRRIGLAAELRAYPNPLRRNEVGSIETGGERPPTAAERTWFDAIATRHSHRRPFTEDQVPDESVTALLAASTVAGVQVRPVPRDSTAALARLLTFAATVARDDDAYQRELRVWQAVDTGDGDDGYLPAPRRVRSLPWAGLVDRETAIPDDHVLTERLDAETVVLLCTVGDGRSDHLNAGRALEQLWLDLTTRGLVASVLTQPLHIVDVRAGLIERLDLTGYPQVLLRIGYPSATIPASPRRPLDQFREG